MKIIFLIFTLLIVGCASNAPKAVATATLPEETEPKDETETKDPAKISELMKSSLLQRFPRWKCTIDKQVSCIDGVCVRVGSKVWIQINASKNSYDRCNRLRCNSYQLDQLVSGIYTSLAPKQNLQCFLKALNDGSSFTEVFAVGLTTFQGSGKCVRD